MRHLKKITLAALAALAFTAFVGSSTVSATTLEITGVKQKGSVRLTFSIAAGKTVVLRDTFGFFANSCTETQAEGETESNPTTKPTGKLSSLTFGTCGHTVTVHNPGKLYVEWAVGTHGTLYSEEAEITFYSTIHGTHINCKTGPGTPIGTLTGVEHGHATMDINATLNCGSHLGSAKLTGTYTLTGPTGLGVVNN